MINSFIVEMGKPIGGFRKRILSCWGTFPTTHTHQPNITEEIREEYAEAFRTQSYFDFWSRVLEISSRDPLSSSSARLPSYRLFAEHLLDPNQVTVTALVNESRSTNETKLLLADYFLQTANASLLCSHLLTHIDKMRGCKRKVHHLHLTTSFSTARFHHVQSTCTELWRKLEISREAACANMRVLKRVQRGRAMMVAAVAIVTLSLVAVTHGLMLMVCPGLAVVGWGEELLEREYGAVDAAAKGAYILVRDLDTMSRMVGRVNDDLEGIRVAAAVEVVRRDEGRLWEKIDELEEHLYLCIMTINRARGLVVDKILDVKPT